MFSHEVVSRSRPNISPLGFRPSQIPSVPMTTISPGVAAGRCDSTYLMFGSTPSGISPAREVFIAIGVGVVNDGGIVACAGPSHVCRFCIDDQQRQRDEISVLLVGNQDVIGVGENLAEIRLVLRRRSHRAMRGGH